MNRRTVIKNLALAISGAVLLPSCLHHDGTVYVQLKHISINADDQSLIADIAETIIPKTNIPGAKELNLPAFVLKMLDDCYGKKQQQTFMAGLVVFKDQVKKKYDRAFSDLDIKEREAVLNGIENSGKTKSPDAKAPVRRMKPQKDIQATPIDAFYWGIKQQTVFGYTTSQYFMTKQIVYELVPGRYVVHFPVKKLRAV